jgi:2'-5' RNA ligase
MSLSDCFPIKRAFIAIPLEGEALKVFRDLQGVLVPYEENFRFQSSETPHLTLQYWDELMDIEYYQVIKQAQKIVLNRASFMLHVNGVDAFDDRVLFFTVAFSEELARLKKACPWPSALRLQRRAAALRFENESKIYFHPHITLAHIKNPNTFVVHKKKIMKLFKNVSFDIPVYRLRLYAEIDGVRQAKLRNFEFA